MSRFRLVVDRFYPEARALRAAFDERFADPRSTRGDRFVWDWWHVPDQYTVLRTPAWLYFAKRQYAAFHRALVTWGRRTLGCWDVSPPWLSCYVEGCQQHLHSDVPHGPWAFVYSLTPPGRPRFSGGETLILRPEVLSYWPTFPDQPDRELGGLVDRVPSRFDRLVVFDPRFPHGVTRVSGTQDPREGRLVIHGWFTEPKPFVEGALRPRALERPLDEAVARLGEALAGRALHGVLSARITIDSKGAARAVALADTLVDLDAPDRRPTEVTRGALAALTATRFPRARGKTEVTLPLLFR